MHELPGARSRFVLRSATLDDFDFAETLTRTNMAAYYKRHGLSWRGVLFLGSWRESENFIVERYRQAIGVLRINQEADALHIRDIQIAPAHRGLGAGSFVLRSVHGWARQRHSRVLQLRVFVDNPALRLYERLGYRALDLPDPQFQSIVLMECAVDETGLSRGNPPP